ncbi:MAG: AAA family ATPase [Spirochaetota bacterium]
MSENLQYIHRSLSTILPHDTERKLVLITGARQTGKTTLAKKAYPHLQYINFDSPEIRLRVKKIATTNWPLDIGTAILDEVQKAPEVFEKIKYCFDEQSINFSLLLGSSQILLLKNIRESLAGRIWIYELWPFMLQELIQMDKNTAKPLFAQLLESDSPLSLLGQQPSVIIDQKDTMNKKAEDYLLQWGGMPALRYSTTSTVAFAGNEFIFSPSKIASTVTIALYTPAF